MTNIKQKALALLNKVARERGCTYDSELLDRGFIEGEALCRAIEQHEAFRQEVSDAVEAYLAHMRPWPDNSLRRFIIAKPDPLVEAFGHDLATDIRAAIEKRGGKIVWGEG